MNAVMGRMQEFADQWEEGVYETKLVPLEDIKQVPIALFTATDDDVCPYDIATKEIPRIQSETTRIDVEGIGHEWFGSDANSDWFMQNLVEQLQVPEQATPSMYTQ
mmetsp:Transcript_26652/g.35660  ORF Transcript_26652/g.35660 Transcript_26652/m.35660 type:complete len:106 (-) Transcript_26652:81-398(-)|eukprot:CAMPEP_0185578214 /NCGR_PEP_ID=MMETSP0434-20130131/12323_1 /TAXON_ID=626734 ORGANISM="Favella taraikaensis, Strain Fe Narragansett Bay" /NCGR_SAMPLE_ID=MMETSP0434 /ASSEMBLY_ACC=CAM_ASM_000379 /LENGTH=105 /DNA_ID=CAMNT_0028195969 /DNA_START=792 /DNA_END=1109 /DNA_ORIENTATION=+